MIWSEQTKKMVIVNAVILTVAVAFFQNCAKSIDLSQYQNAASTGTSTTPSACTLGSTVTWDQGPSTCSATNTTSTLPSSGQLTFTAAAPSIGTATFTCSNGSFTVNSGATCNLSCTEPASFSWTGSGGTTCTATGGQTLADNQSVTVAAQSPNTGSATFACSANQISVDAGATCAAPATPGCTEPATFSWTVGSTTCTALGGQTLQNLATIQVNATSANQGSATFTCANQQVTLASSPAATCVAAVAPPTITSVTPVGYAECIPATATFTVSASGSGTLSYQWYSNTTNANTGGSMISGATATTYSTVFPAGVKYYYVVVSNSGGSATSNTVYTTGESGTPYCGGCFVAGTPVTMADGSRKPIDEIKAGDHVLAFNELVQSTYVTPVLSPIHHEAKMQLLHHFTLADGRTFTSNDIHPIYVVELKKFVKASAIYARIENGETLSLQGEDGKAVAISNISLEKKFVPVYNLEVEGLAPYSRRTGQFGAGHSYYVNGILVHNIKEQQ